MSITGDGCWPSWGCPPCSFFFALFAVPESPRWLALKGRDDEALGILTKVNGATQAKIEWENIQRAMTDDMQGTLKDVFSKRIRPVLWLGIALAIFSQTVGINAIMYYAPLIFQTTGAGIDSALMQTILIGGTNLVFTVIAIGLIDRLGHHLPPGLGPEIAEHFADNIGKGEPRR